MPHAIYNLPPNPRRVVGGVIQWVFYGMAADPVIVKWSHPTTWDNMASECLPGARRAHGRMDDDIQVRTAARSAQAADRPLSTAHLGQLGACTAVGPQV
jgi:hypothetical protein